MKSRIFRTSSRLVVFFGGIALARPGEAKAQTESKWLPSAGFTVNTALGHPSKSWGLGAQAALLRRSGRFAFGVEAGYQAFGTEVTTIDDFNNEPGAVYRGEFERSILRLALLARLEAGPGPVRPYLIGGAGGYDGRFHERIEVRDPTGTPIPLYDFEGSGSDVKPGLTAGLGLILKRPKARFGLGVEGRWHGVLDIGEDGLVTANFLSFGLTVTW